MKAITPMDYILIWKGDSPLAPERFQQERGCKGWQNAQFIADCFWRRWKKEYRPELQHRQGTLRMEPNLQQGELVIVTDKNLARNKWKLGRVINTTKSDDGIVRQVKVKTAEGILNRPVTKLCRLEMPNPTI